MFAKDKMMECMTGLMSREEKMKLMGKMMDQFCEKVKAEGEGKGPSCGEKKPEETGCCADMGKVMDCCSQMKEKFFGGQTEKGELKKTCGGDKTS